MKVTQYSYPLKDTEEMVPHMFECIKSRMSLDLMSLLGKVVLVYFPITHPLHTSRCYVGLSLSP
jgi:hypothetical protein